jgi:hypothetical protein
VGRTGRGPGRECVGFPCSQLSRACLPADFYHYLLDCQRFPIGFHILCLHNTYRFPFGRRRFSIAGLLICSRIGRPRIFGFFFNFFPPPLMLFWLAFLAFASGRGVVAMSFPSDVMSLRSPSGATCDITKHGAHVLSWSQSSGKKQGPYKESLYLTLTYRTHAQTCIPKTHKWFDKHYNKCTFMHTYMDFYRDLYKK